MINAQPNKLLLKAINYREYSGGRIFETELERDAYRDCFEHHTKLVHVGHIE